MNCENNILKCECGAEKLNVFYFSTGKTRLICPRCDAKELVNSVLKEGRKAVLIP